MLHSIRIATVCVTTVAAFAFLSHSLRSPARPPSDALASLPPDRAAECAGDNPYLVTVCYRGGASPAVMAREPAVVAFRDTAADTPHYELATQEQVGAVYGLAYSAREDALYAAAFHKRQIPFGPGGPGAVYRIDLASADVVHAVTVPNAGPDRHAVGLDRRGAPYAGKTSLGDIDLSADGTELYVPNLEDRRIYRFRLPDGHLLGSFPHGASGEPWAAEARPFGLAIRNGLVYHAVVRTAETTAQRADLALYIYESAPDGTAMRRVAEAALDYGRGWLNPFPHGGHQDISADWLPWADRPTNLIADYRAGRAFVHPMPTGSDIVFGPAGELVVGLRDRAIDMMPVFAGDSIPEPAKADPYGFGAGDIVRGTPLPGGWRLEPSPEHFNDDFRFNDETTLGGLAALDATGTIVSNGWGDNDRLDLTIWGESPSVLWFDAAGGGKIHFEAVCRTYGSQPQLALPGIERVWADNEGPGFSGSTGDVEMLCGDVITPTATLPDTPTPSPTPTSSATAPPPPSRTISPPPSATPSPSRTPTGIPTTTPTATPVPRPLYLPLALRERCDPQHKRADVALVIDTSSSMAGQKLHDAKAAAAAFVSQMDLASGRDQVAVVRYDTEAEVACGLTNGRAVIEAAIRNLTSRSGTHIDKGLRLALAELQSARHNERNLPVIVLLTDGIQTGTPGQELSAAAEVRAAGVRLYTIGLGADVDAATLREMAGDARRYHFAPDSADLARIYSEIASDILCPAPAGGFWPGRSLGKLSRTGPPSGHGPPARRRSIGPGAGRDPRDGAALLDFAPLATGTAMGADPESPADWVFVSDDDANPVYPGCDAHSVIDGRSGEVLVRGGYFVSPGRLTATSDGAKVISVCSNNGQFVYVLRRQDDAWREATTDKIEANVLQGSRCAVTPDDRGFLVSMGLYPGRSDLERYEMAGMSKVGLGQRTARRRDISAAEIVFGRDPNVAVVLDSVGLVHFLDTRTLQGVREPIEYERPSGTARNSFRNTNAAVSPDGGFLVVNTGNRAVITVIDLDTGLPTLVELPGLHETWDLEFNFALQNHGLLAVHGRTQVAVYRFAGAVPPALVAATAVVGQVPGDYGRAAADYFRGNSIAWTASGDGVIAAVRATREYRVWRLEASAPVPELRPSFDFDGCTGPGQFLQNDVLTLNRRAYATPTATSTPCPTPSPTEPATPTPPPTSMPTPEVTPSTTAAASRTATATRSITAVPAPRPAFLPIGLRERCDPLHKRADVALVVDTSSSMAGTKLEDAKLAAAAFVGQMDLEPGRDQVAVVRYDAEAEVVCRLTRARAVIEDAIRRLTSRSGTHIDAGLRTALAELQSPRHLERNLPVIVLLTDGVQTWTPGEELRAAEEVRDAGVRLYTIGLGADVDAAALVRMAGDERRYHFVPDSAALAGIYAEIASDILCPAPTGGFWPGR